MDDDDDICLNFFTPSGPTARPVLRSFQLEIVFLFGISLSLLNRSNAARVWPCSQRVAVLSASGRALSVLLCSQRV